MSGHRPRLQWSMGAAGPVLAALDSGDDTSWQDFALCATVGGDAWFPEKGKGAKAAKAVCRQCFVRAECLEYALDHDERWGIWGAKSERERRDITRQRRREAA